MRTTIAPRWEAGGQCCELPKKEIRSRTTIHGQSQPTRRQVGRGELGHRFGVVGVRIVVISVVAEIH